ncbi:transcriptional regulator [Burkholderia cepacia JBK9]|uniref:LysR family transcriptional regulator n=1 Tax=Burkholderia arboris TaxID=488730 RepID=UPI000740AEEB|nr:LysR family transcriptional regulator [Burkholderia arboris]ALX16908.1 transcriptional regulator [Burkholderia cepacia JBK9]MCA8489207.1 LysR family transcriptional regulator [Burkholderia arboris]UTV59827.1 LysR family transcriptional regulator [Burkholderia arboris]
MDPSQLPSLAWFVHIAHHLSFTKAAAEMGVSRAALSQNLKALERQLNVKLLYRTTRDMSLTEDGQRLYDTLRPAFGSIELAIRNLHEVRHEPSGLLRINTSRVAARNLVEPHLGEFMARYPLLRVELVMDDGLSNIIADGYDAGIRLGESLAEHMVAVPITPMLEMAVVGSPDYFARHGTPATPADLIGHNCLCYRHTTSGAIYRWEFTSPEIEGHAFEVEPHGSVVTNDDDGMIRAALQGIGLIQHQDVALREHLDAGTLVRVLDRWCKPFPGYYLYTPSREQMPAKVRALMDFLVEKREHLAVDMARRAANPAQAAAPKSRKPRATGTRRATRA